MANIVIVGSLVAGLLFQYLSPGVAGVVSVAGTPVVTVLLVLVGVQLGVDLRWITQIHSHVRETILISVSAIIGSLAAAALFASVDPALTARETSLIASGLSFYSLSTVILERSGLHSLALLCFVTNLFREVLSLSAAPIIARLFGVLAPIAATASASDSGAPIIIRACGQDTTILCVSCAFVLSLCVPLLTSVLLAF
ncbi:MAG: hypothetical protein Greene041619_986 [Candidatus Peregrinibacteria bacterium Greene0416_19]|nr:MAG: hypothetical protein Greene041619_986 [Candidatus Peregrinibacteria bacterium Greene0416_19]